MSASRAGRGTDDVAEIKQKLDIVQLIGTRVPLKRSGRNFSGLCPFHSEKTPSFSVSPEKQTFHCFGCSVSGDIFEFVMRTEGIEFRQALVQLADQAGVQLSSSGPDRRQKETRDQMLQLLERAADWYCEQLTTPAARKAQKLIKDRGLAEETARDFRLGYAPAGGKQLLASMDESDREVLHRVGLLGQNDRGYYDFFRDRLMFPIADRSGRTIAFCGRRLDAESKAKYINSPESEVFSKGQIIYGLHRAMRQQIPDEFIVVEGHMDVIAMANSGWNNSVAIMGTALAEQQAAQLLRASGQSRILLCLDGDEAGRKAAWRAVGSMAPAIGDNCEVRLVFMPEGEDPDSLLRSQGPEALRRCLKEALPLSAYIADRIQSDSSAESRSSDLNQIVHVLRRLPDTLYRRMIVKEVAEQSHLSESDLNTHIGRQQRQSRPITRSSAARPPPDHSSPGFAGGGFTGEDFAEESFAGEGFAGGGFTGEDFAEESFTGDGFAPPDGPPASSRQQIPPSRAYRSDTAVETLLVCLMRDPSLARELEVSQMLSEAAKGGRPVPELILAVIEQAASEQATDWLHVEGALAGMQPGREPGTRQIWQRLLERARQLTDKGKAGPRPELLNRAQKALHWLTRQEEGGAQVLLQQLLDRLQANKTLTSKEKNQLRKHLHQRRLQGQTLSEQEQQALQQLS